MTQFRAILPRRDPMRGVGVSALPKAIAVLEEFGFKGQSELQRYPPQRGGGRYRRTGNLGRRWTKRTTIGANKITLTIGNNAEYGVWVQGPTRGEGPKQVKWAGRYGWVSVTSIVKKTWPRYRLRIIRILAGR